MANFELGTFLGWQLGPSFHFRFGDDQLDFELVMIVQYEIEVYPSKNHKVLLKLINGHAGIPNGEQSV